MVTMSSNVSDSLSWKKAFIKSAPEFDPVSLETISGDVPDNLQGSFYSIGPGLLERNGERIAHWFDGDGGILKVKFSRETAIGMYRYIQTEAYQKEAETGKFSFGSYGRIPSGSFWQKLTLPIKNRANSGIVALDDNLLALWSAGAPYVINPEDLSTQGIDKNFGSEKQELPYSSNPKIDPDTGNIYNFGIEYGSKAKLKLYCSDSKGNLLQQKDLPLDGFPYIHNFILAGPYLVFFIPPLRLQLLPFLSKQKSFSECLAWKPEEGTQILVVDRSTFKVVSEGKTEPWFSWNYSNGYFDKEGNIVTEVVCYEDFGINDFLKDVPNNRISTSTKGKLWTIVFNPLSGEVTKMSQLINRPCEYPVVPPQYVGKSWNLTYLSIYNEQTNSNRDLPDTIACLNRETGELTKANLGENCYPVVLTYVNNNQDSESDWVIAQVFNGKAIRTEIWIFLANKLNCEPVCKLALPEVIPFSFSAVWKNS